MVVISKWSKGGVQRLVHSLQNCKASLVRIQLPPQGSTVILCSPMVRISLFHREDRGSIPRIGIMGARNINNKDCLHIR